MSVAGVGNSSVTGYAATPTQNTAEQELQQLAHDLKKGDLAAAQKDYVTLKSDLTQGASAATTSASTGSPASQAIAQTFTQLGKDLSSGDLSAAQQDFTSLKQQIKGATATSAVSGKGHHHHHGGGGAVAETTDTTASATATDSTTDDSTTLGQLLKQLGDSLSSGSVSSAHGTLFTLQQAFTALTSTTSTGGSSASGTFFQAVV